ncbi:MAG: 1,2-phenylacetyl-CoA epoxidase subunit PaaC [Saprospiraceae bacterium]
MTSSEKQFILRLADDCMILGQRLGEWCGHGPVLEQDIALTNIALDLIGEARAYYHFIGVSEGKKEDDYPMLRLEREFRNCLLVEQPNGHFGDTIIRQFLFDTYHYFMLEGLCRSNVKTLAEIAEKSVKEARYHLNFSSEWVKRLGDGTSESHDKIQVSLNDIIEYYDELFTPVDYELECIELGVCQDFKQVETKAKAYAKEIFTLATLEMPENYFSRTGGKSGIHSEYIGFILTELQYMQRAYPNMTW